MAFMFETCYIFKFPKFAIERNRLDTDYINVNFFLKILKKSVGMELRIILRTSNYLIS
jgi:hypothetical protein